METPAILMLTVAILGSFFASFKIHKALEKRGNLYSLIIAAGCFVFIFILIYFTVFIGWIIFGGGFSRR